jgi:Tfp pilus assembly protein PilE
VLERLRTQRGETLIELIVSAALLGILGVGMLTALSSTIIVSNADRSFAGSETVLRSFATTLERRPYKTCTAGSSANPYSAADLAFSARTGYTTSVESVKFLNNKNDNSLSASDFQTSCPTTGQGGDQGAQMFTIVARRTDGSAEQKATVILRRGGS